MSNRKGTLQEFKDIGNRSRMIFHAPSRGLIGFRYEVLSSTRGNATVNSTFSHYGEVKMNEFTGLKKGKLVSMETGKTTGYALTLVEARGTLFVGKRDVCSCNYLQGFYHNCFFCTFTTM
jgi:GTP-binding protein